MKTISAFLVYCCRRPKEITGRVFPFPLLFPISIPMIIRIADWLFRGAWLWKALLRFFVRGKEAVAPHLDSAAAVSKAHQKKPSGTALDLHLADGAVRFDDVCLISYPHGNDHVLTIL